MNQKKLFDFLKEVKLKNNKSAQQINNIIKLILNIWDNDNIKFILEGFYYGFQGTETCGVNISLPGQIDNILKKKEKNNEILFGLRDKLETQDMLYLSNFTQLRIILSLFDSNLIKKDDIKFLEFLKLNKMLIDTEIDKYYKSNDVIIEENLENNLEGGKKYILSDSKHNKFIFYKNNKYQILNKMNDGYLVSDKNNNVKFINIL